MVWRRTQKVLLAAESENNDNDQFALVDDILYYIGADSGDFEKNETLTLQAVNNPR